MQIRNLFSFFLITFLLASLVPILNSQAQTYLMELKWKNAYLRIPSFTFPFGAISLANTPTKTQLNLTINNLAVSNTFGFNLQYDNLTFYYQPALNEELDLKQYDFVNETHAMLKGKTLVYRPENIVGSYAVYASNIDQQFGSMKVLHIYRILLIDNMKQMSWANLNISNGLCKITANQTWLSKASYPVVIDPTFGKTSIGSTEKPGLDNSVIFSSNFTASASGTIDSISAYTKSYYAGKSIHFAIYLLNGSKVGGQTELVAFSDSTAQWHNATYATDKPNVTNGIQYELCVQSNDVAYSWWGDSGQVLSRETDATYPTFTDPATFDAVQSLTMSIYATYTPIEEGQDLIFGLVENLFPSSTDLFSKELKYLQTGLIQPSDVISMSKAIGGLLTAFLSTNSIYPSASLLFNKELAFWKYDNLFTLATSTMTKAVQLTLFELFEFVKLHASNVMVPVWTALTIEIAVAIGVLALVLAICGISLVVLRRRRE